MSNYSTFAKSYSKIEDPKVKEFIDHLSVLFTLSIEQEMERTLNKSEKTKAKKDYKKTKMQKVVNFLISQNRENNKKSYLQKILKNSNINKSTYRKFELHKLDIKSDRDIFDQIDLKKSFRYLKKESLIREIYKTIDFEKLIAPNSFGTNTSRSLNLNLNSIKCLDDTREIGKTDKIALGGISIDSEEKRGIISEIALGNFKKGQSQNYNPPKMLTSFNVSHFQNSFFLTLVTIAEKDSGGFTEFINHLYDAVEPVVGEIIHEIAITGSAIAGMGVGAAVGSIGGPVGALIGLVVGMVVGALVGFISNSMKDDIFEPYTYGIEVKSSHPFTSPIEPFYFEDFGGKYQLEMSWSLI